MISHFVHLGDPGFFRYTYLYTVTQIKSPKLVIFWIFGAYTRPCHILEMARRDVPNFHKATRLDIVASNLGLCHPIVVLGFFVIFRHARNSQEFDTFFFY